jgi:hypothetical protein
MVLSPGIRKFALTAHVTSSVSWLGAVAAFLTLAVTGLTSTDGSSVRSAYSAMEMIGWAIIVPLSLASPLTGLIQSLGTSWGLFRHYWVVIKFLITIPATALLVLHMQPVGHLARVVADANLAGGELAGLRIQLLADAGAAIVVLLVATTLSIYKPRGLTPYGRRKQREENGSPSDHQSAVGTSWGRYVLFTLLGLVVLFIIIHLAGGGLHGH